MSNPIVDLVEENIDLKEEIERLTKRLEESQLAYLSVDKRNSKAIEYINNKSVLSVKGLDLNICDNEIEDLLNILQGSDSNE